MYVLSVFNSSFLLLVFYMMEPQPGGQRGASPNALAYVYFFFHVCHCFEKLGHAGSAKSDDVLLIAELILNIFTKLFYV